MPRGVPGSGRGAVKPRGSSRTKSKNSTGPMSLKATPSSLLTPSGKATSGFSQVAPKERYYAVTPEVLRDFGVDEASSFPMAQGDAEDMSNIAAGKGNDSKVLILKVVGEVTTSTTVARFDQ